MKGTQLSRSVANRRQVIAPRKFEVEVWYYVGKRKPLRAGTSIHVEASTHAEAERKARERLSGQSVRGLNWIVGPKLRAIVDRAKGVKMQPRRPVVQSASTKLRVRSSIDTSAHHDELLARREAKRAARKQVER